MSEVEKGETPAGLDVASASLAREINAEHRAFTAALKKTLEHAIRAGELLTEAKSKCPHGSFMEWVAENFDGSYSTASTYMRLYKDRDELRAKVTASVDLSISGALKALSAPEPEVAVDALDSFPPEEAAILKRALDTCEFCPQPNPERLIQLPEARRRGFVAEVAWSAMLEQGKNYVGIKHTVEEDLDSLTPEIAAELQEQADVLRWWVEQVERLETLVRARDWPPGRGMPEAAFDEELRDLTLSELYDPEIGLPSPRVRIREFCGNVV